VTTKLLPAINPVLPTHLRFPSEIVFASGSKGLSVHQLFVGVSSTESLSTPALTEKLFGVKLLPLPLESLPNVVAVVPELSAKV
tara:strand:+ start:817 stop:1068 length:252 start_codon:yes stop_codon:yes gene_type:complete